MSLDNTLDLRLRPVIVQVRINVHPAKVSVEATDGCWFLRPLRTMSIQEPSGLSVSGRTTTESTDNGISRTRIFDLLSNERRVYILEYLADHDGHSTFKQIVEGVASREYETDTISSAERNRVYASLSQTHIPTLTEEGVIEYDSTSGAVSLADGASAVLDYLRPPGPLQHLFRSVTSALSA